MSLALATSGRLRPDIRLAKAVSQFEADLSGDQKATFRTQRSLTLTHTPQPGDVMRLTAEIDRCASRSQGLRMRCVGPRLTNILQAIQQYVGLGDIIIGGSQNLIACGVWTVVRTSLLLITSHATYLEKLSILFMNAGRSAPRYQQMALLYPRSKTLQANMCEYLIVIVQICHRLLQFSKKSYIGQFAASLSDSDVKQYQTELDTWAASIKEEVNLLMGQKIEDEAKENSRFRTMTNKFSETAAHRKRIKERLRILDACSTFDHQTLWKQARKIGNTSLFVHTPEYDEWRTSRTSRTFVCTGKLGSGKSVLLANMIDDLNLYAEVDRFPIGYFFCRHDVPESLRPRTVIGSLVRQILSTAPELPVFPYAAVNGQELDLDRMLRYCRESFAIKPICYLVLDGLDECSEPDRQTILKYCRLLQQQSPLALCVSFRLEADNLLQLSLSHFAYPAVWRIPDNNPEIAAFIDAELQDRITENKLIIGDPTIVLEIRDALLEGSQGMFLWVALQISSLCAEKTDRKIRDALKDLPKDLSKTFSRILDRVSVRDKMYQKRILQLVAVAYRPLAIEEFREALSVTPGNTDWDPAQLVNDIYSTLACCGSLITVDEEDETIRFVHHSVKQYLIGDFQDKTPYTFNLEDANRSMGQIILTYLSYNVFHTHLSTKVIPEIHTGTAPKKIISSIDSSSKSKAIALKLLNIRTKADSGSQPDYDIGQILASHSKHYLSQTTHETFAFHSYAKTQWLIHTKSISESDEFSTRAITRLFEGLSQLPSTSWGQTSLRPPSYDILIDQTTESHLTGHLAEHARGEGPAKKKTFQVSPLLYWALENSHLPLFRHLLKTVGAIRVISSVGLSLKALLSSPKQPIWHKDMSTQLLPFAALRRSAFLTRKLLDNGALVSYQGYCAVTTAILRGNIHVLKLLFRGFNDPRETRKLLNNLDIDAVLVACLAENAPLVSLLASLGADVNRYSGSISPLCYILQLLSIGPDFLEAAQNLVDAGAKLHLPMEPFGVYNLLVDVLEIADSSSLTGSIVRQLDKEDLDRLLFDCCASHVSSPNQRNFKLASFALQFGADAKFYDDNAGKDCLFMATLGTDPEVDSLVELLLEYRASPMTRCEASCLNALGHCLLSRKPATIGRFLRHGLERSAICDTINTLGLLHRRIMEGDYGNVEFLCSYRDVGMNVVNPKPRDKDPAGGETPLFTAMNCGHKKFDPFSLVLDIAMRGADLNYKGPFGKAYPLEAVIGKVTYGGPKLCFHQESASYIRLASSFVALGAHYEENLIMRVINLSLSLFSSTFPIELEGDSVQPPAESIKALNPRKNLHQSHLEDSILFLLEQLFRVMVNSRPPSSRLKQDIVYRLHIAMQNKPMGVENMPNYLGAPIGALSYLFMGHIITILGILATSMASAPLFESTSFEESYSSCGQATSAEGGTTADSEILTKLISGTITKYALGWPARSGDVNEDWMKVTAYPLLKYGREFHETLVQQFQRMPGKQWEHVIMCGMKTAVSEGDVESVQAGYRVFDAVDWPVKHGMDYSAISTLQKLNEPPEDGVYYELESTTPFRIIDMTPSTGPVELPSDSIKIHSTMDNLTDFFKTMNPEIPKKKKSRWWRPDN